LGISGTLRAVPRTKLLQSLSFLTLRFGNANLFTSAPGADDNASAVAIALEMVRILAPYVANNPPAASIIIAAVSGEEQGLYGSNFLAQTCKLPTFI
jgi:Zn-dependent M28 family amino/carboxypeptidase